MEGRIALNAVLGFLPSHFMSPFKLLRLGSKLNGSIEERILIYGRFVIRFDQDSIFRSVKRTPVCKEKSQ